MSEKLNINVTETIKMKESMGSDENVTNPKGILTIEELAIRMYRDLGPNNIKQLVEQLDRLLKED